MADQKRAKELAVKLKPMARSSEWMELCDYVLKESVQEEECPVCAKHRKNKAEAMKRWRHKKNGCEVHV